MSLLKQISIAGTACTLALLLGCQDESNAAEVATSEASAKTEAAANGEAQTPEGFLEEVKARFAKARPDLVVVDVQPIGVAGMYQVRLDGKGSVYMTAEGDHFFVGDLYQLGENRIVNVSEEQKNGPRAELMAAISRDDMIIFSPEGEVKASVVVFTDVDCGYCRKLHNEVPKMNALGIEIKYLAYPRAGIGSESYKKIASAWCADDPQAALTTLKTGGTIPTNVCDGNPVPQQFNTGMQAGLSGTPAIILESGELIPGYMPADKLAKTLGI